MKTDEPLDRALNVRVTAEDVARLDALAERISVVSKNGLARAAMRLGLDILEADPARILGGPPKSKRKRGRSP